MSVSRWHLSLRASRVSWIGAVAISLALCAPLDRARADTTDSPGLSLDRLMATLAQKKSGHATFVEEKYLSIAAKPIESSGELTFVAPDRLEKITLAPSPERFVVDGDKLTIERNDRRYTIALAQYPELAAFIESIRATLSGNRLELEQLYNVTLAGHGEAWTLTLAPLDSRMAKVVRTITLEGTRDLLRTVEIRQADGDWSVMRLRNASNE
jgi:outer membrane lipoprotein-sorting protein